MTSSKSPSTYFKSDQQAFEVVVRLGNTRPGQYDKDEIQDNIARYFQLTSLGDIHREAISNIRGFLESYKDSKSNYPEAKGYGVIGQFGDGKTHFLTVIHQLLSEQNESIHPDDARFLVLDPFQFTKNPADIVQALQERVKAELGPDAAERIPQVQTNETEETIEQLIKQGLSREQAEQAFEGKEVSGIRGEASGHAFSKGCKETVAKEKYDAIVLLIDEIEGIHRGGNPTWQDLDRYREFFDEIDPETPVLMIMTAPRDQWSNFENIHQAMMDRAFGPEPRQSVRLRPLNEQELAETWEYRRENYLVRDGVSLPAKAEHEHFPLHTSTLRAIHQIAQRGHSNRTAIHLMQEGYGEFLSWDSLRWVTPGDIFMQTSAKTAGDGGIFVQDQYENICDKDQDRILTSIAATLQAGIQHDELVEIIPKSADKIEDRITELQEGGWVTSRQGENGVEYSLRDDLIDQLLEEDEGDRIGEIEQIVRKEIANSPVDDELLQQNIRMILENQPPFESNIVGGSQNIDEHYFVMESTYGNFHNRRILVTTGDHSETDVEELREEENAELAIVVNLFDRQYTDDRVVSVSPKPLSNDWEYEVAELEFSIEQWICAYNQLSDRLAEGGHALLSGLRSHVVGTVLDINEFEFGTRISDQLETIYPVYPGPLSRMNTNARKAYITAIEEGMSGRELDHEDIEELGYATGEAAINDYMDEWIQYDLAEERSRSPRSVTVQISESEELILEIVDDHDQSVSKDTLLTEMAANGYTSEDVDNFMEISETRGFIRQSNGTVQRTQSDLFSAKIYLETVETVGSWLTDDAFPESFRQSHIQNRDEIAGKLQFCRESFENLKQTGVESETTNPVADLIETITEAKHEIISTIESFENTDYAQRIVTSEQLITELQETGPDDEPRSSIYMNEVDALNKKAKSLANGARAYLENNLQEDVDDQQNVFTRLNNLRVEFIDEFVKVGPHDEYNTEDEVGEVLDQFQNIRPNPSQVSTAIQEIETFENRIGYGKRLVRVGETVRNRLLTIEDTDYNAYDIEGDSDLAVRSQEVVNAYNNAEEQYLDLAESIIQIGFPELSDEEVSGIEEEHQDCEGIFDEAQEKQRDVDTSINEQARKISKEIESVRANIRGINSSPNWTILSQIRSGHVRERAQIWREEFEEFADQIENAAERVLEVRPNSVDELAMMIERHEEFKSDMVKFDDFASQLVDIEETYFDAERDDIPPGKLSELQARREKLLDEDPSAKIETLLDRIQAITSALQIDVEPMEERIKKLVRSRPTVTPDEIASEVPSDAYQETPTEVMVTLNDLISSGEIELGYDDRVVLE